MSNIDWAVSQALGGKPIDSELYRLRAVHEEKLRGQRAALEAQCAKALALKGESDTGIDRPSDPSAEVSGLLASATTMLADQQENLARAKQEREAYRLRFGITRAPVETGRITSILFLLVVIFIESLINASFFQNAHMAASPFAALLTSLLISITNVTACACAGYFIGRYIHYGNNASDSDEPEFVRIRRRAKFLFWYFLTVMTFFHLTVGLIRSSESLDHIIHNWLNYQELMRTPEAVFLMMTGACLSVLAYYKGKNSFDDPYPGYGLRHRAVKAIQDEIVDCYDAVQEAIEERFDEAQETIKQQARQQQRRNQKYNQAVSRCYQSRRELKRAVGAAESELRMQVAQLASAHLGTRGRKSIITGQALDHLVRFDGFLDVELPAYIQSEPDNTPQTDLARAKSAALEQLSTLFEDALKTSASTQSDTQ